MRRPPLGQIGQHRGQPVPIAERAPAPLMFPDLDHLQGALAQPLTGHQRHAGRLHQFVLGVATHIARHEIHASIAIKISRRQTGPDPGVTEQSPRLRHVLEAGSLIEETPDRPPLERHDQIAVAVVVDIEEHRPTHPPEILEGPAPVVGPNEGSVLIPQAQRRGRLREPPGHAPPGDKPVEISVLIDVGQDDGSQTGAPHRQHDGRGRGREHQDLAL